MNFDLLFALIFYTLLVIFFYKHKKNVQIQGKIVALYRTKIGLKLMGILAKKDKSKKAITTGIILIILGLVSTIYGYISVTPHLKGIGSILFLCGLIITIPIKWTGFLGVIAGFTGMAFIFYFLLKGTFDLFLVPEAPPAIAPVLPGIKVLPGLPVLSFWHWILAIFFVALVHEFAHGIYSRVYKTKVKSSGIALFGPILGAFVEPDEKELSKKSKKAQLSIFAAGPFSNIIFGIIFLLLFNFISGPIFATIYTGNSITVNEVLDNYPASELDVKTPFHIHGINNNSTHNITSFLEQTQKIKPGDTLILNTDQGDFTLKTIENPDNKSKAFIGIAGLELNKKVKESVITKYGTFLPSLFSWVHMLIFWLAIVNVGVGLFNLLPLGPVDGGRMFLTGMLGVFKPKKAKKIWAFVSYFCLLLIFINLSPYLWKLVVWIFKPIILILGI